MLHVRLWLFSFIGHAKDKGVYARDERTVKFISLSPVLIR